MPRLNQFLRGWTVDRPRIANVGILLETMIRTFEGLACVYQKYDGHMEFIGIANHRMYGLHLEL